MDITKLKTKECATIIGFTLPECEFVKRLMALGFTEGTPIRMLHKLPFGGPLGFEVKGAKVMLRRDDAKTILVSLN